METRTVNGRTMTVKRLPAEDPEVIRNKVGLCREPVGQRRMVPVYSPDTPEGLLDYDTFSYGRMAPKYNVHA